MKKLSFVTLLLLIVGSLAAQKASITFENKIHDFGQINESDGKAVHVFKFTNEGATPLVISRVQASCGCTTPDWTRQPIEPGQTGNITVAYNPAGRPGIFTKTISVYSNASEEVVTLMIKGDVVPVNSSANNPYPVVMGDLGLKMKIVQLNNVNKGNIQARVIGIKNTSKSALKPTVENLPAYITVKVVPETLKANEEGTITFTFNSNKCNIWGPVSDDVFIALNGKKTFSADYQLKVFANVVEDFGKLTREQRLNAPILEANVRTVDLGTIKQGNKKVARFKISNKGVNALEVRRVINNNTEISAHSSKMTIASGKSSDLSVELNTKLLPAGDYKKSISLQTNDPDNAFVVLVLSWKVQK